MTRLNWILTISLAWLGITSCAARQPSVHETTPHEHKHPFTEVIGDYHLRLVVDHDEGKMALLFEDIKEEPARLVHLEWIYGRVLLPDGAVKDVYFKPTRPMRHKFIHKHHRHMRFRLAGTYVVQTDWLKSNPRFELQVPLLFKGKEYKLIYNYEMPSSAGPSD